MQCVKEENILANNLFFLDGHGGTGKTFVYITLCHALRGEGSIVLCVASTGVASLLLPGGRTAHSTFKIPIDNLNGNYLYFHIVICIPYTDTILLSSINMQYFKKLFSS